MNHGAAEPQRIAQMTNAEARMTKEARMTNPEFNGDRIHSAFGFRHSFVIRASAFVISQNVVFIFFGKSRTLRSSVRLFANCPSFQATSACARFLRNVYDERANAARSGTREARKKP